jgi:hypothetical protein
MKLTNTNTGYSGTPLINKLGIKEGTDVLFLNSPDGYKNILGELHDSVTVKRKLIPGLDFIQLFIKNQKELKDKFPSLKKSLNPNGQIWISWPKKSSKITTDVTENTIRDFILQNGMVDVKVCAIDETWSGLKLVFRLKDRKH